MNCENLYKGMSGEERVKEKLKHLDNVFYGRTYRKDGQTVELDCMVVNDDGVYLIEIKNYKADKIVFETSGTLYRHNYGKVEKIDTLSQVARARGIMQDIVGREYNIYNVVVFVDSANNDVEIIDNMNNPNIKIVCLDFLPFLFQNNNMKDKEIDLAISRLRECEIPENKFENFDAELFYNISLKVIRDDIESLRYIRKLKENKELLDEPFLDAYLQVEKLTRNYKGHFFEKKEVDEYILRKTFNNQKDIREYVDSIPLEELDKFINLLEEIVTIKYENEIDRELINPEL